MRLRLGRSKAEKAPEEESPARTDDATPHRALDLIGSYHAAPVPEEAVPEVAESAVPARGPVEPAMESVEPAPESVGPAPERVEPTEIEERGDVVAEVLNEHIEAARGPHYAFTLIAVRVPPRHGDTEAEERELRDRVASDLRQLVHSTEEPDVVLDADDAVFWVIVPGLLPRRAAELVDELGRLLDERGMPPVTAALAGYPRDGATAEELLEQCRTEIEQTSTHPAARRH